MKFTFADFLTIALVDFISISIGLIALSLVKIACSIEITKLATMANDKAHMVVSTRERMAWKKVLVKSIISLILCIALYVLLNVIFNII